MRLILNKNSKALRGVTFVELLVVVAILVIIAGITASSFGAFRRQKVLENAAGQVAALLREARALTLASRDGAAWGVHFEATSITLFRAPIFMAGAMDNKPVALDASVALATTSIAGGGSDIVFKKISGETNNAGTTTISRIADPLMTRMVTVSAVGIIQTK